MKVFRGLGPLMGLLALGVPVFAEPLAVRSGTANTAQHQIAADSARFFHPLITLLGLAAAGSVSSNQAQAQPGTILGWDALRETALGGSIWMVRDRWMGGHGPLGRNPSFASLLRC